MTLRDDAHLTDSADAAVAVPTLSTTMDPATNLVALSRRGFVSAATLSLLAAALGACGGGGGGDGDGITTPPVGPPPGSGVTFSNNVLTVPLSGVPSLAAANGFQVFTAAIGGVAPNVVAINLGGDVFKAFTSVCTHSQCSVNSFSGGRIGCPCHGSEFDTTGLNVAGPAPSPLREYATSYNAGTRTLTITKS